MTIKDNRQQNAERRLRKARWESEPHLGEVWLAVAGAIAALLLIWVMS